jgi:hypothetical protein
LFETENPRTQADYAGLCQRYKAAYDEYYQGRFTGARELFAKLATEFNDGPSRLLADRCATLAAHPPVDWKGVWRMEGKG